MRFSLYDSWATFSSDARQSAGRNRLQVDEQEHLVFHLNNRAAVIAPSCSFTRS